MTKKQMMRKFITILTILFGFATIGLSEAFDYSTYNQVLAKYVDEQGWVDYKNLKANRAGLDAVTDAMADLRPESYQRWSSADRKAFWSNAYNALTLKLIIDNYPIKAPWRTRALYPKNSIRQIPGAWKKVSFPVMGRHLTLDAIEHEILRKDWSDPGIHFAIVCASISCPPLRNEAYTGERWEEQIKDQLGVFLGRAGNFQIDHNKQRLALNPILNWFQEDFTAHGKPLKAKLSPTLQGVVGYLLPYVTTQQAEWLTTQRYDIHWLEYDWSLNTQ